jgi:Putative glycosyl hydrolase domain/Polysaccharide deacetylase
VSFLAETRKALAPHGTYLGASVFGIAATRPEEIAQNVPKMAREVDYIAPMVYPSHWGTGEYGLSDPESNPYDIVAGSLKDFEAATEGTGARIVPWLQDFSLRVPYGPAEVKAQITATEEKGIKEFLLWDPEVTYTSKALQPNAKLPATGSVEQAAASDELVPLESRAGGAAADVAPVDTGLAPNELGVVPVLMYHQLLAAGGGEYDGTPSAFRKELARLYDEGYRPVTAADYASGTIDLPAGATPVVLTFDDSTPSQAALLPNGEIDPDTAVGILVDFAKTHPGFTPVATLYLNDEPFKAGADTGKLLTWLVDHGFELGNHTRDHANLSELGGKAVQRQLALEDRIIHEYVPTVKITTMALPFGIMPDDPKLALAGSWKGTAYQFDGVMLVGANPAPSPFSTDFDPGMIPRIRSWPTPDLENGSADWLDRLAADPELRYVSDGDPRTISYADGAADKLAAPYAARGKPNS